MLMSVTPDLTKIKITSHSQTAASNPVPKYFVPFNIRFICLPDICSSHPSDMPHIALPQRLPR